MTRASRRAGFSLMELLVYITILAVLMNILTPLMMRAWQVSAAAQQTARLVQQAELALEVIGKDLRRAAEVTTTGDVPAAGARMSVRFPDGSGAAYALVGERLVRYELGPGAGADDLPAGAELRGRTLAGSFKDLSVSPVAGARRVWRVDLEAQVEPGLREVARKGRLPAHFATAFHSLPEGAP